MFIVSMSLTKSALVGSAMGPAAEVAECKGDEAGAGGVVVAEGDGGGAAEEEERLDADTRLSRA